jgi:hypothetical protein
MLNDHKKKESSAKIQNILLELNRKGLSHSYLILFLFIGDIEFTQYLSTCFFVGPSLKNMSKWLPQEWLL